MPLIRGPEGIQSFGKGSFYTKLGMASKHCLEQSQARAPEQLLLDLSDKPHLAILGSQAIDLACYDQLIQGGVAQ